jgi:integrase
MQFPAGNEPGNFLSQFTATLLALRLGRSAQYRNLTSRRARQRGGGLTRPISCERNSLHPLLKQSKIPRGGFHAARHGVTSEMLEGGVALTVVQRQLRYGDARITLGTYGHVVGNAQRRAVETHEARVEKYAVQ